MQIQLPTRHRDLYSLARAYAEDMVGNTLWIDPVIHLRRYEPVTFGLLLEDGSVAVEGHGEVVDVDTARSTRVLVAVERWAGPGAVMFWEMSDPMRPAPDSVPPPDFGDDLTVPSGPPAALAETPRAI